MKKSAREDRSFNPRGRTRLMGLAQEAGPGSYDEIRYELEKARRYSSSEEEVTITCKEGNTLLHYAYMEINSCDYRRAKEKTLIIRYLIDVCQAYVYTENKAGERPVDLILPERAKKLDLPHLLEDELRGEGGEPACRLWASKYTKGSLRL